MRLILFLSLISGVLHNHASAQASHSTADSLFGIKNFRAAAHEYFQLAKDAEFKRIEMNYYYLAARSYAAGKEIDSAFHSLDMALEKGWNNKLKLENDYYFTSLYDEKRWKKFLKSIPQPKNWSGNPDKVQFITTDIVNFWDAYDRAQKDTANRISIYKQFYIDKGTEGLQAYMAYLPRTVRSITEAHVRRAKYYAAIKEKTLDTEAEINKKAIQESFFKLKDLIPNARFPNVYFLIGDFRLGGVSLNTGLMISIDMYSRTSETPTDELKPLGRNAGTIESIPHIVAHELIHYQQYNLSGKDPSLLASVLQEGMADFIGELISGKPAYEKMHNWAKGKEKQIWDKFIKEMYLRESNNWIGNVRTQTEDHPADLGYWVGYMICKAYYMNASDKKQAVHDMLHIQDYKAFYDKSKVEEFLKL